MTKMLNRDEDLLDFIKELKELIEKYDKLIDGDNFMGIFIHLAQSYARGKGLKPKEVRRGLKSIIDNAVNEDK